MATLLPQETYSDINAALSRAFSRGLGPTSAVDQFSARLLVSSSQVSSADGRRRLSSSERHGVISRLILDSVNTSIASLLRAENARRSLYSALPPELWCSVWSFLPFATRVAVSHTCSRWRSISVGCPDLWTQLNFYVTAHATDCKCTRCLPEPDNSDDDDDEGTVYPSGWDRSPYPEDSSNMSLAEIVLPRSAGLPLFLTVHIVAYNEQRGLLSDLASVLCLHRHRIQDLEIRAAELLTVRLFMQSVGDWPSLRDLTMGEELNDLPYPDEGCIMLQNAVMLPQLASVSFLRQCIWPNPSWQHSYPTVHSIDVQPAETVGYELLSILTSCRNICTLGIDLEPAIMWYSERGTFPELPVLASGLRSVSVRKLWAHYEDYIVDIFQLETRPSLSLEYERREDIARGRDIFHDLSGVLDLRVSFGDGILSFQGADTAGRTRRLALRVPGEPTREDCAAVLSPLAVLRHADVRSIAIDASLWWHLIEIAPVHATLVSLEIVVHHTWPPPVAGSQPSLPALQSVTLLSYRGVVRHSAPTIDEFIRGLQLPLLIPLLRVDHRLVQGSADLLRGVAHSVDVGIFHVPG